MSRRPRARGESRREPSREPRDARRAELVRRYTLYLFLSAVAGWAFAWAAVFTASGLVMLALKLAYPRTGVVGWWFPLTCAILLLPLFLLKRKANRCFHEAKRQLEE